MIVTQFWPVGIQRIGSRTYFVFFAVNLVGILLVALCFPETKGKRLEEMDDLFGGRLFEGTRVQVEMDREVEKRGTVVSGKEIDASGRKD